MNDDDPRHGTTAGHAAGCRDLCCRTARNADERRRRKHRQVFGVERRVDGIGTRRRIRALWAIGWTSGDIAAACGWSTPQSITEIISRRCQVFRATAQRVAEVYDRLSQTSGPSTKNRRLATRNNWPPPAAWDDIDDPNEIPAATYQPRRYAAAELVAEWEWLRSTGATLEVAASRLGVTVDGIEVAIRRVRAREVA